MESKESQGINKSDSMGRGLWAKQKRDEQEKAYK